MGQPVRKHGVACIVLYDGGGRFLLQHRDDDCENLPGYWGFFGGSVEPGESVEQALRRESQEELSHTPEAYSLFATVERRHATLHLFVERCEDKSHLRLGEGQGWGWYALEEMKGLKMRESDRVVLRKLRRVIASPKA